MSNNNWTTDPNYRGLTGNIFTRKKKFSSDNSTAHMPKVIVLLALTGLCFGLLAFVWSIVLGII